MPKAEKTQPHEGPEAPEHEPAAVLVETLDVREDEVLEDALQADVHAQHVTDLELPDPADSLD